MPKRTSPATPPRSPGPVSIFPLLARAPAPVPPHDNTPDAPARATAVATGDGTPDSPLPLPRLLSAAEVAAVFGRSARTVHEWVKRGLLIPLPMGRSLFFPEPDIRALLAGRLARRLPHR